MSLWDFFDSNFVQNIILVITVGVTIWIYFVQMKARRRDAARIIVMQIDSINQKTEILKQAVGNDTTTFYPDKLWKIENVIENNEWEKYRHLFVKKLHYNEIVALNNYYDNVISIRFQQDEIKGIISEINKDYYVKHSEEAQEEFEKRKKNLRIASLYLDTIQIQYTKIRNSREAIPYEQLKKIAKI